MDQASAFSERDFANRVLTVSELNRSVAGVLERSFPLLWVAGEISNLTRAASGHWYFTLKDGQGCVRAVMFRSRAAAVDFKPSEGMHVEVRALVTLYAARGEYQLSVEAMRRSGVGQLYEAFLRLRDRLAGEGLFDSDRKRALPVFPRRIGVVTSAGAAALRDVLTTLRRRAPHVEVVVYPSPVQGAEAPAALTAAVRTAAARGEVDVLIVCRGGGSIEDLWAFNDEGLARAIAASPIPTISGVGHETDFTITDFVADVRAATPTAAAELVCIARDDALRAVHALRDRLQRAMVREMGGAGQRLDRMAAALGSPAARVERERARIAAYQQRLAVALRLRSANARGRLGTLQARLRATRSGTTEGQHAVERLRNALRAGLAARLAEARHRLALHANHLRALDPQQVVTRGYCVVTTIDGHVVTTAESLQPGDALHLQFARGRAAARVTQVDPEDQDTP